MPAEPWAAPGAAVPCPGGEDAEGAVADGGGVDGTFVNGGGGTVVETGGGGTRNLQQTVLCFGIDAERSPNVTEAIGSFDSVYTM